MFGRGASITEQVEQLERDVATVKADLASLHRRREQARQDEVRAWAMLEAAQANQHRVDIDLEKQLAALASLRQEIQMLIPEPRQP
jgi:outer membrane murein-binding lipoprotein Lpp